MNGSMVSKTLKEIAKQIHFRESALRKEQREVELMRNQYDALLKMFNCNSPPANKSNKPRKKIRHSTAPKNLFPVIVDFVKKNPGSTVADIRKAVKGSDQSIRYHLDRNKELFIKSNLNHVSAYSTIN